MIKNRLVSSTLIASALSFVSSIAQAQDVVRTVDAFKSTQIISAPTISRISEGSTVGLLPIGPTALAHSSAAMATFVNLIGNGMSLACALGGAYLLLRMLKPMPLIGRVQHFFFGMLSFCAGATIWTAMNWERIMQDLSASMWCG